MPRRMRTISPASVIGQRRDDEARVDVGDVAAGAACEPLAILARDEAEGQRRTAPGAEVERGRQPGRDAAPRWQVGRTAVGAAGEGVVGHIGRRSRAAGPAARRRPAAPSPIRLTATQASRNRPLPRSTGIHAQADRQIRTTASAVVSTRRGAPISTHSLTSGLTERDAQLQRGDRDRAGDEHRDAEEDVVMLEGRRCDFRHGARREPLEARWERGATAGAPAPDRLAVEDRHAGFPALVVHAPECIRPASSTRR